MQRSGGAGRFRDVAPVLKMSLRMGGTRIAGPLLRLR